MSRAITYGVPFVGNDFKVVQNKPQPTKTTIIQPQEIQESPAVIDAMATLTLDSAASAQTKVRNYALLIKLLCIGLAVVLIATLIWTALSSKMFQASSSSSEQSAASKASAMVVSSESLGSELHKVEGQNISFVIGGSKISATTSDIHNWIISTPTEGNKQKVSINSVALDNYLAQLAPKYNINPVDQVAIAHTDGTSEILTKGSAGFVLGDMQSAKTQITNGLLSGQGMNVNLPGVTIPFHTTTTTQAKKRLEVDVTTKRMNAYENDTLVKTFLITAGAPATPTPIGTYKIWEKVQTQDMRGLNPDGSKYFQPNVQWVSYFDHSGDAVHGNYWRPTSVFGNTNTSHGCVGLQNSDAKWVYDWAPIGTEVAIHS